MSNINYLHTQLFLSAKDKYICFTALFTYSFPVLKPGGKAHPTVKGKGGGAFISPLISTWDKILNFCLKHNELLDFQRATRGSQCDGSLSAVQHEECWSAQSVLAHISKTPLENIYAVLK